MFPRRLRQRRRTGTNATAYSSLFVHNRKKTAALPPAGTESGCARHLRGAGSQLVGTTILIVARINSVGFVITSD